MKLVCHFLGHDVSWRFDPESGRLLPCCRRCKLAVVHSKGSRPPQASDNESGDGPWLGNGPRVHEQEAPPAEVAPGPFYEGTVTYSRPAVHGAATLERSLLLAFIAFSAGALLSAYGMSLTGLWRAIDNALSSAAKPY